MQVAPSPRVVVLASGSGSTLQALLDAAADPAYGVTIVAVGSDRPGTGALDRARAAGVNTFVCAPADHPVRSAWDSALADAVAEHDAGLVVSAGFMRLLGKDFLARFGSRVVNSHPALLPAYPGMHGPRDALAGGAKITGVTLFVVDDGVDTGPIVAQCAVTVLDDDDEAGLHERIKVEERAMLVDVIGRMAREGFTVSGRKVTIP